MSTDANNNFKTPDKNFKDSPSMLNITSKLNTSFKRSARLKVKSKVVKRAASVAEIRNTERRVSETHANQVKINNQQAHQNTRNLISRQSKRELDEQALQQAIFKKKLSQQS